MPCVTFFYNSEKARLCQLPLCKSEMFAYNFMLPHNILLIIFIAVLYRIIRYWKARMRKEIKYIIESAIEVPIMLVTIIG